MLVARPRPGFDPTAAETAVQTALTAAGAHPPTVRVRVVDTIPAGAAGKRPLVVALPHQKSGVEPRERAADFGDESLSGTSRALPPKVEYQSG